MTAWKTPKIKQLARALLALKTEADMMNFLRDLCTLEELREMSARWEVVDLLAKKIPYRKIAKRTGLSTATISRIAHWLYHGEGGYQAALRELAKKR